MVIAYVVIFGVEFGSGHLVRAKRLQSNSPQKIDIICIVNSIEDQCFLPGGIYRVIDAVEFTFLDFREYDLIIFDELGLFVEKVKNKKIPILGIDPINSQNMEIDRRFDLNYDSGYKELPSELRSILLVDDRKVVGVVQGGGDDHHTVSKIVKTIPSEYYIIVAVNQNCRHIAKLQKIASENKNVSILIDFPLVKLFAGMDCIITAGGNALLELLSIVKEKKIILYSEEPKEHITFDLFIDDSRVIKRFNIGESFNWGNNFIKSAEKVEGINFFNEYIEKYK
jgi:spore coat polysaccharide biosynthesis predicted glycosyltransferase SpsG